MEYSVEELKSALIEKCKSEGILYATVAMDRRTKEMILPDTLQGALKHPEFFVCFRAPCKVSGRIISTERIHR